ncbi:hypothetical protein ASPZODRAFT_415560 [Penicilliopsis zonata CBS 506.65]|uniref:Uncharacterized protein n=1 Tax=Penicilliopsis zonata CBS 506.65 TaxID=1073090 RepID=A0A1L9SWP9_9EURO|nr:hypothetical protein ASPZODRAFT_415560 [Penicilliopsis zonata CBS 506.65]OJJ51547.1 hypothetical protein ASPZODRAFT_415560 [Penicilliopsis zonata CBS 506.65]
MKKTSIFGFNAWSKIHPPLPRTPRESQQLLNALTSSFRRQLDREYPQPNASEEAVPTTTTTTTTTNSSTHATEKHLRSILENPLFRVAPQVDHAGHRGGADPQKRLAEEPMAVFDELVASGSVTKQAMCNCLKSQLILASLRPQNLGVSEAMSKSKAASKVVEWFWASDSGSRKMLFKSRSTTSTLLKFMAAEGLQETVAAWLKMIVTRDLGGSNGRIPEGVMRKLFGNFLKDAVAAELRYGAGITSALTLYTQSCRMYLSLVDKQPVESRENEMVLFAGGSYLSHWIVDNPQKEVQEVPQETFDEFEQVMSSLFPGTLLTACVPLYNPSSPRPGPLLDFMKSISAEKYHTWSTRKRDAFFIVSSDAISVLIDEGKYREASNMAQLLQQLLKDNLRDSLPEKNHQTTLEVDEYALGRLGLALT